MKVGLLVTITSLFLIIGGAQNAQFNCRPRRGCQLSRCDPEPMLSPTAALKRNEYPIVCVGTAPSVAGKSRSDVTRREYSTLVNLYGKQRRSLDSLNVEVATLRFKHERLENSTKLYSGRLHKTELSLRKVEETVSMLRNDKNKLQRELNELKNKKTSTPPSDGTSSKIKALESSLSKVLQIVAELQLKNSKLERDIKKLSTTKAPITERPTPRWRPSPTPRSRPTTPRWQPTPTTRPITPRRRTPPTTKSATETTRASSGEDNLSMTSAALSCDAVHDGACFFLIAQRSRTLDFDRAKELCEKHSAFSALITSENMYKAILKFVKEKLVDGGDSVIIRTGMLYDSLIRRAIRPFGAYIKWAPGAPRADPDSGSIVLRVSLDESSRMEGMINISPYVNYYSVLCQRWNE